MDDIKEKLVHFILMEDISSIQILSRRLGISQKEVRELLEELVGDSTLIGYISKDETRFFRHDVKQPNKESKGRDNYIPDYGEFDTRPGIIISVVGMIILGVSTAFYTNADSATSFTSSITMFVGLVMLLVGCYCLSMKRSPI